MGGILVKLLCQEMGIIVLLLLILSFTIYSALKMVLRVFCQSEIAKLNVTISVLETRVNNLESNAMKYRSSAKSESD